MKILMVPEKDSANFSLTHIERAFRRKGHQVDIYAPYYVQNVLRMFDSEATKFNFEDLDTETIEKYDIIFASVFSIRFLQDRRLLNIKKYIFTYDFLIHGDMVNVGDFNFAPSLNNTLSEYEKCMLYPKVGIGEPKFDLLKLNHIKSSRLLFVESGHIPFGDKGRRELAKVLLDICKKFPDYELCIKPRFLPSDEVVTHSNLVHLYDVIYEEANGELPDNLNLLKEHVDLEELINTSRTVLCLYTTAYISAAVADKGLIIIDNLPNEDNFDLREKRIMQCRTGMIGSNALVDYKKVIDYLPDGIKCPESHLRHELSSTNQVADKIVSVTEYIYDNYISKGVFPDNVKVNYEDFFKKIKPRNEATWEDIISQRLENVLKYKLITLFDFRINAKLDLSIIFEYINSIKENNRITEEVFYSESKKFGIVIHKTAVANEEAMTQDEIDLGILLDSFYQLKLYDKVKNIKNKDIGAYEYFRGKIALEENDISLAKELFERYIQRTTNRKFMKEVSDQPHYKSYVYYFLSKLYADENDFEKSSYYMKMFEEITPNSSEAGNRMLSTLSREQAYSEVYKKWIRAINENKMDAILDKLGTENLMVYGAGSITENLVVSTESLYKKVICLVDAFCDEGIKFGLPVIRPEQVINYPDIKTVLVTAPHVFKQIKNTLLNIRNDLNVISISSLFE